MATLWTGSTVPFEEYPNSPTLDGTATDRVFTRMGKIAWDDIDTVWAEAFPPAPNIPAAFPGNANFRVKKITMKPLGATAQKGIGSCSLSANGIAMHEYCELVVQYGTTKYDDSTRRQLTINFGVEVQTVPSAGLYWDNGDRCNRLDIPMNVRVPVSEINDTYFKIPTSSYPSLLGAIRFNIGKVNAGAFSGAAPETLLFTGSQVSFQFDSNGSKEYTAVHRFSEKNVENLGYGWNHYLDPDAGQYRKLFFDAGLTIPPYATSADFGNLFP